MVEEDVQLANYDIVDALQSIKVWNTIVLENVNNSELREWGNERVKETREYHVELAQSLVVPAKKQRTSTINLPNWSKYIAIAQELSLKESGKLIAVPETIFRTNFGNGLFIRQEYVDVGNKISLEQSD